MARITTYKNDTTIEGTDKLLGTDSQDLDATKNYLVQDVAAFINTGNAKGTGTTSNLTLWSDGPNGVLGNAPIKLGTGTGSLIMGAGATASGENSMAIGYGSIASGDGSFAGAGRVIGSTVGGQATGRNAFAFGYLAKATNDGAIAIGSQTQATATNSVALGNQTFSTGINSFAAGLNVVASGQTSTALGANTTASGNRSFACGDNTTASGTNSFAAGRGNTASGDGSIVMGGIGAGVSTAAGEASVVLGGELNTASGANSTILGGQKNSIDVNSQDSSIIGGEDNAIAAGSTNSVILGGIGLLGSGTNQTICGVANVPKNNCKFIVGIGTYTNPASISRENGFEVRDNGQLVLNKYTGTNFNPVAANSNDLLSVNAAGDVQQSRTLPRGIKVGPDTISGTIAANAGAIRYREDSNNSYVDMIMKVSQFGYAWVNIVQNSW